jgi:hypothetical protein
VKICVAVPNGGTVKSRLCTDVISALFTAQSQGISIVWADVEGTLGPHNRWLAGHHAITTGADALWLMDNDVSFPADALLRLLSRKKDLIGAAYNYRVLPRRTTVKMRNAHGEIIFPDPSTFPNEPFRCHATGFGCMVVTTAALRRIPQPWFAFDWNEYGELYKTDDVWFCEQAQRVGIQPWCDPTLEVRHIGDFLY